MSCDRRLKARSASVPKQKLIEIDNRGERLTGCLTCNVWWSRWSANAVKLSEEDLHALHELRRTKTPE